MFSQLLSQGGMCTADVACNVTFPRLASNCIVPKPRKGFMYHCQDISFVPCDVAGGDPYELCHSVVSQSGDTTALCTGCFDGTTSDHQAPKTRHMDATAWCWREWTRTLSGLEQEAHDAAASASAVRHRLDPHLERLNSSASGSLGMWRLVRKDWKAQMNVKMWMGNIFVAQSNNMVHSPFIFVYYHKRAFWVQTSLILRSICNIRLWVVKNCIQCAILFSWDTSD